MSRADESDETPEKDEGKPASQRRLILVSGAVVVALAVVGVVVYLMVGDNGPDNASDTDVPTITGTAPPTTKTTSSQAPATSASQAPTTTPPPAAEGEPAEAKSVAEQAATAISTGDVTTIAALSCDPASVPQEGDYPTDAKAEVVGEPKITGDTATIDLRLTIAGTEPTIVPMPLTRQDGRWCVP